MKKINICILCILLLLSTGINCEPSNRFSEFNDIVSNPSLTGRILQIFSFVSIIMLAPSILIMVTSFTRIIIVFSILRTALGLQQTPSNQILISLALFLTFFIMSPAIRTAYNEGLVPLLNESIEPSNGINKIIFPFKNFMIENVNNKDLNLFASIANIDITDSDSSNVPIEVLIPSFMISELKRGFEMGFLLFLPFIIIDIVVASLLMSMGMMMMPPVMISLAFKIIFFVMIDGWSLLCGSLVQSFFIS